jgi:glycosyltransferase involved in cell wall biosynthesis
MLNFEFPPLGGGAAPLCFDTARRIIQEGHKIDLVTMGYKGLKAYENIEGINVYRVPCIRKNKEYSTTFELFTYLPTAFMKALKLTKKNKYDINHTHFIIPTGFISYLLKKIRNLDYVITSHGSDVPNYNPDRFKLGHKLLPPIWKLIIKNAKRIITPSEHLKNLILKTYTTDKIDVIFNGIDIEEKVEKEKEDTILFAGRLLERKGVQYIIEAIKDLNLEGYKVIIVGDGPYREELEKKAEEIKDKIQFIGWIDQKKLKELYAISKIFILPSTQESFGMVIAEAMEKNMAVICGEGSACSEVLGKTGITLNPRSSKQIKRAIEYFIKNPSKIEEAGKLGRKRAKRLFDVKNISQNYIELYNDVIKTKTI